MAIDGKKSMFEWNIRLGDVVTILSSLLLASSLYFNIDKRVTVGERVAEFQVRKDDNQDAAVRELKAEIKDALKDVSGKIDKIADKLDDRRK